ncbi:MAG: hypothetical protein F4190_05675 [Acidimicrobiales bacterium]|nr:hypothetical protein [Acidimicrobiales bacterium]MYG88002.1 hypothetical protein [Acidimicrobiales bacterium]MYI28375.1 hypothetical protein [Acidimicrobiales bacterium]
MNPEHQDEIDRLTGRLMRTVAEIERWLGIELQCSQDADRLASFRKKSAKEKRQSLNDLVERRPEYEHLVDRYFDILEARHIFAHHDNPWPGFDSEGNLVHVLASDKGFLPVNALAEATVWADALLDTLRIASSLDFRLPISQERIHEHFNASLRHYENELRQRHEQAA